MQIASQHDTWCFVEEGERLFFVALARHVLKWPRIKYSQPPTQPPTVAWKMEAQSEHVHIACTSLHVLAPTCMLSR